MGLSSKGTRSYATRKARQKKQRLKTPCVFLVVEGKSERIYFTNFTNRNCRVKTFVGPSGDPIGLVKYAENLEKSGAIDLDSSDKLWCVFDRDDNRQESIDKAIKNARKRKFEIAFSNPCFEMWLLWHFEETFAYREVSQSLLDELEPYLDDYGKTKNYFERLKPHTDDAICRAKKAQTMHLRDGKKEFTREFNPSSNIYEIIEEIQEKSR